MTQIIQTNLDELLADCGTIDAVSWQAPKQMTYAQWAEIGEKFQYTIYRRGFCNWIGSINNCFSFQIGCSER